MVRRLLASAAALALLAVVAPACSSGSSSSSSGACTTNADCPSGQACVYDVTAGCSAPSVCKPNMPSTTCAGILLCACDGTATSECGTPGYAAKPVRHVGACP